MAKYLDAHRMGRSEISPYLEHEGAKQRHTRRLKANLSYKDSLSAWCNENGWQFEIKNDEKHWIFRKADKMVEWWPSTAKCILNKQWERGYHCHDYLQVISRLKKVQKELRKNA